MKQTRRINKYKVLLVVAFLLIIFIIIVVNMKTQSKTSVASNEKVSQEEKEEIMRIALENELEEKKKAEEEKRAREKAEEEKATGIIYLTFDDGPSSDSTPQILDILKRNKIEATFFVLHYNEQNEQFVKREDEEGHTVALHGFSHSYSEVYQSVDACIENYKKIQEQVYNSIGKKSTIIRFPGGSSNTISKKYCEGIMTELTSRAVSDGYKYFDWNIDSDDAGRAKTSEDIFNNVTTHLKEGMSNVVLMHDFAKNYKTIDALQRIIDYGKSKGYVFRKITNETPMVTHSVNN